MTAQLDQHRRLDLRAKIGKNWLRILTASLALLYVYIGIYALGIVSYLAIAGGLAVLAALLIRKRYLSLLIIIVGVVPLAVLTWWSIVTPIIASVAIVFGAFVTVLSR